MSVKASLGEILAEATDPYVVESAATSRRSAFAADPFLAADEGLVSVPDLRTRRPVPFSLFPHQREFLGTWIDASTVAATGVPTFHNVLDEKSRKMGLTWAIVYGCWWLLSFHDVSGLAIHLDFRDVDDGGSGSSLDSFFGKIRWMNLQADPSVQAPLQFKYGLIQNPEAGPRSLLVAEGATTDPGRGGDYDYGIIDEAARLPFGEAAHTSLTYAVPNGGLVYNSTPFGEDNVYFRIRDEKPADWRFLYHHWSIHPVYGDGQHLAGELDGCALCAGNRAGLPWSPSEPVAHRYPGRLTSPWYDQAILGLTDEQVAQELDIDYAGSLTARVYPEFSEQVHVVDSIPYDPSMPYELAWDYGLDTTAVLILQDAPYELRLIGILEIHESATPDVVAPELREELRALGVSEKEMDPYFTSQILGIGDPAGDGRQLSTGRPLTSDYQQLGFWIVSPRRYTVSQTVVAVKRLLLGRPKPLRISRATAAPMIRHLKLNRWPTDKTGARRATATAPYDNDGHNHSCRALAYYTTYKWPGLVADDAGAAAEKAAIETDARGSGALDPGRGPRYDMKL